MFTIIVMTDIRALPLSTLNKCNCNFTIPIHTDTHTCTHRHIYVHRHTHVHRQTHIHMCTDTHSHTQKVCIVYGNVYKTSEVGEPEPP